MVVVGVWLESDRCQGNVSHNWELKWRPLRFLEGSGGYIDSYCIETMAVNVWHGDCN
jgi:hypothetical protein